MKKTKIRRIISMLLVAIMISSFIPYTFSYASSEPYDFSKKNRWDDFENGVFGDWPGGAYKYKISEVGGTIDEADGKVKLTRNGTDGLLEFAIQANGDYPYDTTALLKFTLSKSSSAEGVVQIFPHYAWIKWSGNKISVAYRDKPDDSGSEVTYREIDGVYTDTIDVVFFANIEKQRFTLWLNGDPVVENKYSACTNFNGDYGTPKKIQDIRVSSAGGESGEVFSFDNYESGLPLYTELNADLDKEWLSYNVISGGSSAIWSDITLPTEGAKGSVISWSSSDENIISNQGVVTRPSSDESNATVILTACIQSQGITLYKKFEFLVLKIPGSDEQTVELDYEYLTLERITWQDKIVSNLTLPQTGVFGSSIAWSSSNENIISSDGTIDRTACNGNDTEVTLTATFSKGDYSKTNSFSVVVMSENNTLEPVEIYENEEFSGELSSKWSVTENGGNVKTENGVLKISRLEDVSETLATLNFDSVNRGMLGFSTLLSRPKNDDVIVRFEMEYGSGTYFWVTVWGDGNIQFLCCTSYGQSQNFVSAKKQMRGSSAKLSVWMDTTASSFVVYLDGEAISDTLYSYSTISAIDNLKIRVLGAGPSEVCIDDLRVFKTLPPESERLTYDYNDLTIDKLSAEAAQGYVSKDLTLPATGYCGSTITWSSNKKDIVSNDGKVTLPVGLSEDPKVTLIAIVSYGGARLRKSFSFYVIRSFDTAAEKIEADYDYITSNMDMVISEDLNSVTKSLNFNIRSRYGSSIHFESSDTSAITESGRVIRPREGEADKPCTITLTVSADGAEKTYSFDVVVKADETFVDPQHMTDEEFFGKYENGSWIVESKFDYENTPQLRNVESAVKQGDYALAKEELLEYSRVKKHSFEISISNRDPLRTESYIDRIDGAPDQNNRYGTLYVDDVEGTYSAVINTGHFSASNISFRLMSWYNESSELEIYSREGDIFKSAYLEMNVNGVPTRIPVAEDTTIRTGDYFSTNYNGEDKLYSKTYGPLLGNETKQVLLKFDLSSIPQGAIITDAKLHITGRSLPKGSGTKKIMILYETNSAWEESSVSWKDFQSTFYNFNQVDFNWESLPYCDTEFLVQICRFYPLVSATAEYLYTNDEKYAYGIIRIMEEFITKKGGETANDSYQTPMRGQYPRCLDTSERMESVSETMYFLAKSESMTPDAMTAIYKNLWDMYEATAKDFALDGGNWQQNELIRVLRHADEFSEFKSYKEWLQIAVDNLEGFIFDHHYADGSYVESTGGYPDNALNQFIEFRNLAYESGLEVSSEYDNMLLNAGYYNIFLRTPDGRNISWGDSGLSKTSEIVSRYTDISKYVDDEEFKYVSTYGKYGTEPTWTSRLFEPGKIAFLRSSWSKDAMYMMTNVRGGGGHSNADDNHIFLSAYSKPLLVDSGIGSYTSGTPQRTYCGDTIGHNTVEINGLTQFNHAATEQLMPGEINDFITNHTFDFMKSTAVSNYAHDHERNILFIKPYYVIVSDYLTPDDQNSTNSYKQLWHMLPEGKLSTDSENMLIKSNFTEGANVLLASADDDATVETGDGYFDYSYNELFEIKHGYFYKKQAGDTTFDTVIVPNKNDKNATLDTERINIDVETTTATALKFTSKADGTTNNGYYYLSYEDVPAVRDFDKFETDGEMAFANENSDGNISIIALKNASYLKVEDEYVVKLDSKVDDLSIAVQGKELVIDSSDENLGGIKLSSDIKFKTLVVNGETTAYKTQGGFVVINKNGTVEKPSDNNNGGTLTGAPSDNKDNEDNKNDKEDKPSSGNGGNSSTGTITPGIVTPPVSDSYFVDVADDHWAKQPIEELYKKGIVSGKAEKIYAPEDNVTRAEFVSLIIRSLGKESVAYDGSFEDIASGDWYADAVETALSLGLISKDTNFRPNDSITREEMAKIIIGAAELSEKVQLPEDFALTFADGDSISDWAEEFVSKAAYLELLKGDENGNFNPSKNLSRAESAMVIYRLTK